MTKNDIYGGHYNSIKLGKHLYLRLELCLTFLVNPIDNPETFSVIKSASC